MTQILSIANQKGGVGKTTSALNIAMGLFKVKKKVLLVDLDPQGNLSEYLGFEPDGSETISEIMMAAVAGRAIDPGAAVRKSAMELDFIPSNIGLASADLFLAGAFCREQILKRILRHESLGGYDYIIIDCLPSLGVLLTNALTASDRVIIPVQAQKFAVDGLEMFLSVFNMVKDNLNPQLTIAGVLMTMNNNTNMAKNVEVALEEKFHTLLFKNKISTSVEATMSTERHQSLLDVKSSKLGEQYKCVVAELLGRI